MAELFLALVLAVAVIAGFLLMERIDGFVQTYLRERKDDAVSGDVVFMPQTYQPELKENRQS